MLYLLHGMDGTNKDWFDRGHVKDVIDQLTASGEADAMIIVSPDAGGSVREGKWNGYFDMRGWDYEEFFFTEFLPTIEKQYRTLDYQTDANLRHALRQNYRNTTTVLVAQRISSLRHAELILILQDGCVIGAGNHDTLMETCSEYRFLADIQMGDGKETV